MAERKATNKYYPPDWTPDKGSLNQYVGQHPLRERASKLGQGILVIRFEIPFNIWCGGCRALIGRGTRFNAEKKAAGKYFSTTIWTFKMTCVQCGHSFEFKTDPKNHQYLLEGAEQRTETWDPAENGGIVLTDQKVKDKLEADPFFKLEHLHDDKQRAEDNRPWLVKLQDLQEDRSHDDYELNKLLRKKFREEKVEINASKAEAEAKGLGELTLLPANSSDAAEAAAVKFNPKPSTIVVDKARVASSSIFSKPSGVVVSDASAVRRKLLEKGLKQGLDLKLIAKNKATHASRTDQIFPIKSSALSKGSAGRLRMTVVPSDSAGTGK